MFLMLRFLKAGLIAGTRQLVAISLITSIAFLASEKVIFEGALGSFSHPEISGFVSPIITWAYLLTAIGFALTQSKTLILTAKRIGHATRLLGGEHRCEALAAQFIIAAILFAILALRPPPYFLADVCRYAGCLPAAPVVWAGTMTMAVAFFGASAHAAIRSAD
jgi:hypothetical protein